MCIQHKSKCRRLLFREKATKDVIIKTGYVTEKSAEKDRKR